MPVQSPSPAEPARRPGRWRSRRSLAVAGVVVLALVGGLLSWSLQSDQAPQKDAAPFYDAAINLATAPMIHYLGSSAASDSNWDMWVTSGGEQSGTFTAAGQRYGVLTVGGVTYVKPPQSDLELLDTSIPVSELQGRWLAGDSEVTGLLSSSLLTPEVLATELFSGFGHGATFPAVGAPAVQIDGRQALKAVLPDGVVYITASAPYQVLHVDPPPQSGSTSTSVFDGAVDAAYGADAASASALGQASLEPASQAAIDQTYGSLITQTKTLNNAPDIGVHTDYTETGDLNCSDADCTVEATVTTSTTSTQLAALSGGVSAVMTATVTVDGEPGGGCTQTQTLPINGTSTMTCDDPGVAGPVAQVKAQEQEEADAAEQDLSYTINFLADVGIEAMAEVEAQVTEQVGAEQAEQNAADQQAHQGDTSCSTNSFVAGTRVLMADGSTDSIQDVKVGDQVDNSDPYSPLVQQHTVTARHVTETDHDFVHLSVTAPNGQGGTVSVTANHLFYDMTTGAWTEANDLAAGDRLQTPGEVRPPSSRCVLTLLRPRPTTSRSTPSTPISWWRAPRRCWSTTAPPNLPARHRPRQRKRSARPRNSAGRRRNTSPNSPAALP